MPTRAVADHVAKIVDTEGLAVVDVSALAQETEILRRRVLVLPQDGVQEKFALSLPAPAIWPSIVDAVGLGVTGSVEGRRRPTGGSTECPAGGIPVNAVVNILDL